MSRNREVIRYSALVLGLVLLSVAIIVLDPWLDAGSGAAAYTLNLVPPMLLGLILFGLSRRVSTTLLGMSIVVIAIFQANSAKLAHLQQPFIFADLLLLPQMFNGRELIEHYYSLSRLLVVLALLAAFAFSLRLERPAFRLPAGFVLTAAGALCTVSLSFAEYPLGGLYRNIQGKSTPWSYLRMAELQGLFASVVTGASLVKFRKPRVDTALIEDWRAEHPLEQMDQTVPEDRPDIILWLSESFFDPAHITAVDGCGMLTGWCELAATGETAGIAVNTFGGNTTRTEFEVLTGVPFPLLDGHDYPYLSVVNRPTASIAWSLKSAGYRTTAVHPHLRTFWQRHRALPLMGFDRFIAQEAFDAADKEGTWISDHALGRRVIDLLEAGSGPQLIFAISMENHGPWGNRKNLDRARVEAVPVPGTVSPEAARSWREYIYHARNAVDSLGMVAETIRRRDRPTVLVFFGDHMPSLRSVFESVTFDDGQKAWRQRMPVLALANYPLEPRWHPTAAHELGIWTLDLAGQLDDGHYAEMARIIRTLKSSGNGDERAARVLEAMQNRQLTVTPER